MQETLYAGMFTAGENGIKVNEITYASEFPGDLRGFKVKEKEAIRTQSVQFEQKEAAEKFREPENDFASRPITPAGNTKIAPERKDTISRFNNPYADRGKGNKEDRPSYSEYDFAGR